MLRCQMPYWPVPVFSMFCYTVTSLGVHCFLHASMMYVQWSTLVNYAFPLIICTWQLYSLPAPGLDPGENKACVSATAQFVPWAKMATVPDFQTGMMSSTTNQEAVEHAATHMAEEKASQKHIMMTCHFVYILEVCSAMQQYTVLYYTALVYWCPMIYFEVAAQSTLSLWCGCCYHGFRQQSWGSMLTVQTHFPQFFVLKNAIRSFWACCRLFFNQDLWSWMLAILQDSMPSLLIHLLHTLNVSLFCLGHDCWFPSKCCAVLYRWAEAIISL